MIPDLHDPWKLGLLLGGLAVLRVLVVVVWDRAERRHTDGR